MLPDTRRLWPMPEQSLTGFTEFFIVGADRIHSCGKQIRSVTAGNIEGLWLKKIQSTSSRRGVRLTRQRAPMMPWPSCKTRSATASSSGSIMSACSRHVSLIWGPAPVFFRGTLLKRYRKADVVALDIAENMLQQVRSRGGWFRKPYCVCADGESLPFADDSFDFVFSNLMMQWCTDLEPRLHELRRVLAPGGLLMFTTFGPDTLMELRASWEAVDGYTPCQCVY